MRSPNKSRSRGKSQNRRSSGNVLNRVFDSSGPEGKVRGTPQQIIDKYQTLARDAQLSGDRVSAENFLQHCEHYVRILNDAQREQTQRREQHEAQQAQQAQRRTSQEQQQGASRDKGERATTPAGDVLNLQETPSSGLVETPEGRSGDDDAGGGGPQAGKAAE